MRAMKGLTMTINNAQNAAVTLQDLPPLSETTNGFEAFNLPPKLIKSLTRIGFLTPTPIQEQTIELALQGRDILASAQTGTGKTGAFGIPLIARLMSDPKAMGLIMTPTRELATQVITALESMIPTPDIKTALLIGGESMFKQFSQLDRKPRLIVGTPGRINDHLTRGSLRLHEARFVVLDETDRMLDMGFGTQIDAIMKFVPPSRQMLLYSATLPKNIVSMASKYQKDAARISAGTQSTPAAKIKQELIHTTAENKYTILTEQLNARTGTIIMFVKTKYGTEKMATRLIKDGFTADCIHGDLQQRKRDRVIQTYRDKKFRILVATDVAARGLDIPHIEHVINYDLPQCPEDYIHRIGRTARAGAEGEAVNLLTDADGAKWDAIQTLLTGKPPEHKMAKPKPANDKSRRKMFFQKRKGKSEGGNGGGNNSGGQGRPQRTERSGNSAKNSGGNGGSGKPSFRSRSRSA